MLWCLFKSSLQSCTLSTKHILHDLKKNVWLNIIPWGWFFRSFFFTTDFEAVYLILLWKFRQYLFMRCVKSPHTQVLGFLKFILNSCTRGLSVCQPLLQIACCPSVPWASWLVWEMQCARSFWPPLGLGMMVSVVRKQVVSILNCNGEVVRQHTVLAG